MIFTYYFNPQTANRNRKSNIPYLTLPGLLLTNAPQPV
jgi:hypothetical protein